MKNCLLQIVRFIHVYLSLKIVISKIYNFDINVHQHYFVIGENANPVLIKITKMLSLSMRS